MSGRSTSGNPTTLGPGRSNRPGDPVAVAVAPWSHASGLDGCPPAEPLTWADGGNPEHLISPLEKAVKGEAGRRAPTRFAALTRGSSSGPAPAWMVRGRAMPSLSGTGVAKTRKSRKAISPQPADAYHLRLVRPPEVVTSLRSIRVRRWHSSFCGHHPPPERGPRLARPVLALPGSGELSIDNRRATSPGRWSNRPGGADATFARQAFLEIHLLAQTLPPNQVVRIRGSAR